MNDELLIRRGSSTCAARCTGTTSWSLATIRCAIQILHHHAAGGGTPGEAFVSEADQTVAVTLIERVLTGVYPDGSIAAENAAAAGIWIEVALGAPAGERQVIDGSRGRPARRRRLPSALGSTQATAFSWSRVRLSNKLPRARVRSIL